jgi:hypothetical protein
MEQETQIIPTNAGIVDVAVTIAELEKRMRTYQELLKKLLIEDDYATINNKKCIKKSGWLKLAVAFNLSTKLIEERKQVDEATGDYAYHCTVQCRAGNGRTVEEIGSCDSTEKAGKPEHVIRAMAKTRATSRAIAAMIGASESSAEEMEAAESTIPQNAKRACKCDDPTKRANPANGSTCPVCKGVRF